MNAPAGKVSVVTPDSVAVPPSGEMVVTFPPPLETTVTASGALLTPPLDALIPVVPALTPVTVPPATVATAVFEDDQVKDAPEITPPEEFFATATSASVCPAEKVVLAPVCAVLTSTCATELPDVPGDDFPQDSSAAASVAKRIVRLRRPLSHRREERILLRPDGKER